MKLDTTPEIFTSVSGWSPILLQRTNFSDIIMLKHSNLIRLLNCKILRRFSAPFDVVRWYHASCWVILETGICLRACSELSQEEELRERETGLEAVEAWRLGTSDGHKLSAEIPGAGVQWETVTFQWHYLRTGRVTCASAVLDWP
jgi:hypothetical protein